MKRPALPLAALAVLCAGIAAPAHAASEPRRAPLDPAAASYSAVAHASTNKARLKQGLGPLKVSSCLQAFADRQAVAMAAAGDLFHQDLAPVMSGCGLRMAGENVAYGFVDGKDVVKGWMASPGHRANILTKGYRAEAVSAVLGPDGVWYAAQVFGTSLSSR